MAKTTTPARSAQGSKSDSKSSAKSAAARALSAKKSAVKAVSAKNAGKASALGLPKEKLLQIFDLMIRARSLEERLIKVYKTGDSFFWIGGPGEEAFGVPLGMLVQKGQGPMHDFLHLHYRCTPTLVAMGMTMEDSLRLMMNRSTDPSTGGRNFCNHYCFPEWNIAPVSSPIEVQYGMAVGTAIVQRRLHQSKKSKGISIVSGGDAGTAEGDFASCLIWSSRPGNELPIFITVQNNKMGISTAYETQHGEKQIADRGKAFQMRTRVINGNDPIETYLAIEEEMEYIRRTGKPVLAEFMVSRLYGHSSADGANRGTAEDCLDLFEQKLLKNGLVQETFRKELVAKYDEEARAAAEKVRGEPVPGADTIWDNVYANNENADWRKF